jgi:hypothetical protein
MVSRSLLGGLFFALSGCGLVAIPISNVPLGELSVPGDPSETPLDAQLIASLSIDAESLPAQELIAAAFVDGIELAVSPRGEGDGADDLSFISRLEIYAAAEELPRVLVAAADGTGAADRLLLFSAGEVDLKPYVDAGLSLDIELTGSAPPTEVVVSAEIDLLIELF